MATDSVAPNSFCSCETLKICSSSIASQKFGCAPVFISVGNVSINRRPFTFKKRVLTKILLEVKESNFKVIWESISVIHPWDLRVWSKLTTNVSGLPRPMFKVNLPTLYTLTTLLSKVYLAVTICQQMRSFFTPYVKTKTFMIVCRQDMFYDYLWVDTIRSPNWTRDLSMTTAVILINRRKNLKMHLTTSWFRNNLH